MAGVGIRLNGSGASANPYDFAQGNSKGKVVLKDHQGNLEAVNQITLRGAINSTSNQKESSILFERQLNNTAPINTLAKAQAFYSPRWEIQVAQNETGGDVGSVMNFDAFSDTGAALGTALSLIRGQPQGSSNKIDRVDILRVEQGEVVANFTKSEETTAGAATLVVAKHTGATVGEFEFNWTPPAWPTDSATTVALNIKSVKVYYEVKAVNVTAGDVIMNQVNYNPTTGAVTQAAVIPLAAFTAFGVGAHVFATAGGPFPISQVAGLLRPSFVIKVTLTSDATGDVDLIGAEVVYDSNI